jgi:hypothetical protein
MPVPPVGCGAVIFIVWSWDNPVKYTDPDGFKVVNKTIHWIYVKFEDPILDNNNKISGKLLAPGETFPEQGNARVDGVIVFHKSKGMIIRKVRGNDTFPGSLIPILDIEVSQNDRGDYTFNILTPVLSSTKIVSELGPDDALNGWVETAIAEVGDPGNPQSEWGAKMQQTYKEYDSAQKD